MEYLRGLLLSRNAVAHVLKETDRLDEAREMLGALERLRRTEYVDAYYIAMLRHALGQRREAFDELERAHHENSAFLYSIEIDPKMEPLRGDARFAKIRRGVTSGKSR